MLHVSTLKFHHQARVNEEATQYLELPVKLLKLKCRNIQHFIKNIFIIKGNFIYQNHLFYLIILAFRAVTFKNYSVSVFKFLSVVSEYRFRISAALIPLDMDVTCRSDKVNAAVIVVDLP
jgi:hypothetical protein